MLSEYIKKNQFDPWPKKVLFLIFDNVGGEQFCVLQLSCLLLFRSLLISQELYRLMRGMLLLARSRHAGDQALHPIKGTRRRRAVCVAELDSLGNKKEKDSLSKELTQCQVCFKAL